MIAAIGSKPLTEGATKELCSSHISAHGNWPLNESLLNGRFDVYPQRLADNRRGLQSRSRCDAKKEINH